MCIFRPRLSCPQLSRRETCIGWGLGGRDRGGEREILSICSCSSLIASREGFGHPGFVEGYAMSWTQVDPRKPKTAFFITGNDGNTMMEKKSIDNLCIEKIHKSYHSSQQISMNYQVPRRRTVRAQGCFWHPPIESCAGDVQTPISLAVP